MSENSNRNSSFNAAANSSVYQINTLEQLSRSLKHKMKTAGRGWKPDEQALEMLHKVPASHRTGANHQAAEANLRKYLSDKEAGHVYPHSKGGSAHPDNLEWQNRADNRANADKPMTPKEQRDIHTKANVDNLSGAMQRGMEAGLKGAVIGAVTTLPFSFLRNALRVSRGEITSEEAALEILKDTGVASGVGGVTSFSLTYLASAFPPVAIALSAISPALWAAGGVGMISELVGILEHNKHQVRAYYDNLTTQQLENLQKEEERLNYEHNESIRNSRNLVKRITDRPRKSGIQASLERLHETLEIARSLGVTEKDSNLFANIENRYLLSGD